MRRKEYFEFKQFTVHQEHAAMKVGTDGALLGSLAATGKRILDIGTGTGLLSLMMAQRCPDAIITAIDVDENAIIDAHRNFAESPFGDRIMLKQAPFQAFAKEEEEKYDCIICNPPYFDESLESKDESRTRARHTSSLPFRDLIGGAYELLADEGVFSVCIPPEVLSKFSAECLIKGFCLMTAYKKSRRYTLRMVSGDNEGLLSIEDYETSIIFIVFSAITGIMPRCKSYHQRRL